MMENETVRSYEGTGETLDKALTDAARKALADDSDRNLGRQFVILHAVVTVDNPRISEYKVVLGG